MGGRGATRLNRPETRHFKHCRTHPANPNLTRRNPPNRLRRKLSAALHKVRQRQMRLRPRADQRPSAGPTKQRLDDGPALALGKVSMKASWECPTHQRTARPRHPHPLRPRKKILLLEPPQSRFERRLILDDGTKPYRLQQNDHIINSAESRR